MRTPREVAVFVVRNGEHLVLRRSDMGIWHVVAGVVEDGETYERAGLRELREETALALSELPYHLGTQMHGIDDEWRTEFPAGLTDVTIHSYGVEAPRSWEPVLNEEHDTYRWCGLDDACRLLHWREAREMVRKLDEVSARGRARRRSSAPNAESDERASFRLATDADVPELRCLVNAAYRVLGEMGLNYTGVTQDEEVTRQRMRRGEVHLLKLEGQLVGTVKLDVRRPPDGEPHVYLSQLAVDPSHQRQGLGGRLLRLAEDRARRAGVHRVRLDTAIPAEHLIRWYGAHGYAKVGEVQWPGKTYRSVVLEKAL